MVNLRSLSPRFPKSIWTADGFYVLGLTLSALMLGWWRLGQVALRDWDEGTIATVAKEMYRSGNWLYPTLYGGPYLNKPPLVEWLMSLSYAVGGINEWTARFLPAGITACAVPLLYRLGREIFPQRTPALLSALVYLTLLPVVRHGRLAMRDGVAVTFFILLLLCLVKARQDRRWALGIGVSLGLLSLTKGILALLLGAIALIFLIVNTRTQAHHPPSLTFSTRLPNLYFWSGLVLGLLPAIAWYGAQIHHYGTTFWQGHFLSQSFDRIWDSVEDHQGPLWYYLLELLKYSWPWLLFWPGGLRLAWLHRDQSWGQLILVGTGTYLGAISVMGTKLPWYIMPLYPFVALAVGVQLAQMWNGSYPHRRVLAGLLGAIAVVGLGAAIYVSLADQQPILLPIGAITAAALGLSAVLLLRKNRHFISVLLGVLYLVLLLFVGSQLWLWELNEAYPVKPVASLVQRYAPPPATVYTTFAYHRPSLDFYSDRHIPPLSPASVSQHWTANTYFLIEQSLLPSLPLPEYSALGTAEGFVLVAPVAMTDLS